MITKREKFLGSIILGAIGDAMGSAFENQEEIEDETTYYPFGKPKKEIPKWSITDDTQLTIATCEALEKDISLVPDSLVKSFISLFTNKGIKGIGASTLKALQELCAGGHWSQVGRRGEYAAGNGAAMRIAPLAFFDHISNVRIEEICSITHKNTEAYIGALAVVIAIKKIIKGDWTREISLMKLIADNLPDSRVRDRILELDCISHSHDVIDVAKEYGNNGYVVNSIPLAIFAANTIKENTITSIFNKLIQSGGDTDTNCSITGQIVGTFIGVNGIPKDLLANLEFLPEYKWIREKVDNLSYKIK